MDDVHNVLHGPDMLTRLLDHPSETTNGLHRAIKDKLEELKVISLFGLSRLTNATYTRVEVYPPVNCHLVYNQLEYYLLRLIAQPRSSGLGLGSGSKTLGLGLWF